MLVNLRPNLDDSTIQRIVHDQFGFDVDVSTLPSERDQNVKLMSKDGKRFVLKIAHPDESLDWLSFENRLFQLLNRSEGENVFPNVFPNKEGELIFRTEYEGRQFWTRLISFLDGTLFSESTERSTELYFDIGGRIGEMDSIFETEIELPNPACRFLQWDAKHAPLTIRQNLECVNDVKHHRLLDSFCKEIETTLSSVSHLLPRSVIHNDMNDNNFLVDGDRVTGIFDFGDIVHSFTINDLAVASAYAMLGSTDPLKIGLTILEGYRKFRQISKEELVALADLIVLRLCLSVSISARQKLLEPNNEYLTVSEKPAWDMLEFVNHMGLASFRAHFQTVDMAPLNFDVGTPPMSKFGEIQNRSKPELLKLRKEILGYNLSLSYKEPLKIVKGRGVHLIDENGSQYLDCVNNVCHVGHCHPHVVQAAQEQIAALNTNTRYLHDNIVQYAQRLGDSLPGNLSVCYFTNSGSEANDLALRIAKIHTQRKHLIALEHAYHGHTSELIDVSHYKFNNRGGSGTNNQVRIVPIPDPYRGEFRSYDSAAGSSYAKHVTESVSQLQEDGGVAAIIAESASGCGGQVFFPKNYFNNAFRAVREAGGICILDEVQVGFGRFGTMWAFEEHDVVPDIVTMGKPAGNGHPLGILVTTPEIAESFDNGMEYFNTFGGNPVSCAIGNAVLDVIENEGLMQNAKDVGEFFIDELNSLKSKHAMIGDVRGRGLFIGIDFVKDRESRLPDSENAKRVKEEMRLENVLLSTDGPYENVIKIKPPVVFTKENVSHVIGKLSGVLRQLG